MHSKSAWHPRAYVSSHGCDMVRVVVAATTFLLFGMASAAFKRVRTQFIAALGDPSATSGRGASQWGIWRVDLSAGRAPC